MEVNTHVRNPVQEVRSKIRGGGCNSEQDVIQPDGNIHLRITFSQHYNSYKLLLMPVGCQGWGSPLDLYG